MELVGSIRKKALAAPAAVLAGGRGRRAGRRRDVIRRFAVDLGYRRQEVVGG